MTWLHISLFCSRRIAHQVLKEGVQPFIKQCRANNEFRTWFFAFNTQSGENIRLSLQVPANQAAVISIHSKAHFSSFFKQHNFPQTPLHFPLKELFLPFPENSIRFGLYYMRTVEKEMIPDVTQRISEVMMEALGETEIDEEAVLTLCLYFHLVLKKKILEVCPDNEQLLKVFYIIDATTDSSILAFWKERTDHNQSVVKEICDDTYDPEFYKHQPWITRWEGLCTEAILNGDFNSNINTLIHNVNMQLDLTYYQTQLIQYMVKSTWNES